IGVLKQQPACDQRLADEADTADRLRKKQRPEVAVLKRRAAQVARDRRSHSRILREATQWLATATAARVACSAPSRSPTVTGWAMTSPAPWAMNARSLPATAASSPQTNVSSR